MLIFAFPLDLHGRRRVLRSMFIPDALHGIEASFLAEACLRKLRAAILRVVWSRRQSLANPGAVLSLLDGPTGCDPAFCVVRFRFRMLRRFLACRPGEVPSVYRLLEHVADGALVMVPLTCLWKAPLRLGLFSLLIWWVRDGLRVLSILSRLIQHIRSAVLEGWRSDVSADLCAGKGFRGGPWLDIDGTLQLLNSDHVRESILVGGVWNGFLLQKVKGQRVPCRFCVCTDSDRHIFSGMSFSTAS